MIPQRRAVLEGRCMYRLKAASAAKSERCQFAAVTECSCFDYRHTVRNIKLAGKAIPFICTKLTERTKSILPDLFHMFPKSQLSVKSTAVGKCIFSNPGHFVRYHQVSGHITAAVKSMVTDFLYVFSKLHPCKPAAGKRPLRNNLQAVWQD